MVSMVFTNKQVQEGAQVTKSRLIHWIGNGAIIPLVDASGRGKARQFSFQNLVETIICRELNSFRTEVSTMTQVLTILREETDSGLSLQKIIETYPDHTDDYCAVIVEKSGYVVGLLQTEDLRKNLKHDWYQAFITINLTKIVREAVQFARTM